MRIVVVASAAASSYLQPPPSVFFHGCRTGLVVTADDTDERTRPGTFEFDQAVARQREILVGAVVERLDQEQHQGSVDVRERTHVVADTIRKLQVFFALTELVVLPGVWVIVSQQQTIFQALTD